MWTTSSTYSGHNLHRNQIWKRLKTTPNIASHKTTDCGFESHSDWTLYILCGSCMEEKGGTNLLAKDMESVTHFDTRRPEVRLCHCIILYIHGGFQKWGYPKMDGLWGKKNHMCRRSVWHALVNGGSSVPLAQWYRANLCQSVACFTRAIDCPHQASQIVSGSSFKFWTILFRDVWGVVCRAYGSHPTQPLSYGLPRLGMVPSLRASFRIDHFARHSTSSSSSEQTYKETEKDT